MPGHDGSTGWLDPPAGDGPKENRLPTLTLEIDGRLVGEGQPCYVIAEAGVNHNGDPALAKKLVDIAADAGADAVKFQKRTISDILIGSALARPYTVPTSLGATYG